MKINKKAGMGIVMTIILIIVSAIIVLGVAGKLMMMLDTQTQQTICSANIVGARAALEKDSWILDPISDGLATSALQNPLCTSIVNRIDLSKYSGTELDKQVAIEIGEMTEKCWKTFGEGKVINTFAQDTSSWGLTDFKNYYFTCYKFKIHTKDSNYVINTSKLLEYNTDANSGLLWRYNVNKKQISSDFMESYTKALAGDKNYLSYAGHIFNEGYGYVEFMETVKEKLTFGTADTVDAYKITQFLHMDFGIDFMRKSMPNMGTPLKQIEAEKYYEVRYYSPMIKEIDKYKESYVLNNIKIVPLGTKSETKQIPTVGEVS